MFLKWLYDLNGHTYYVIYPLSSLTKLVQIKRQKIGRTSSYYVLITPQNISLKGVLVFTVLYLYYGFRGIVH